MSTEVIKIDRPMQVTCKKVPPNQVSLTFRGQEGTYVMVVSHQALDALMTQCEKLTEGARIQDLEDQMKQMGARLRMYKLSLDKYNSKNKE